MVHAPRMRNGESAVEPAIDWHSIGHRFSLQKGHARDVIRETGHLHSCYWARAYEARTTSFRPLAQRASLGEIGVARCYWL